MKNVLFYPAASKCMEPKIRTNGERSFLVVLQFSNISLPLISFFNLTRTTDSSGKNNISGSLISVPYKRVMPFIFKQELPLTISMENCRQSHFLWCDYWYCRRNMQMNKLLISVILPSRRKWLRVFVFRKKESPLSYNKRDVNNFCTISPKDTGLATTRWSMYFP